MKKGSSNKAFQAPALTACQFIGKSHQKKRMPCQDAYAIGYGDNGLVVLAIADGVSSSPHSELAAQTAVSAVIEFWKDFHTYFAVEEVICTALQACMNYALRKVDDINIEKTEPFAYETTLSIVLIQAGKSIHYINAGDSSIYILTDREEVMLLDQQMRHDDGSVYALSSGPSHWVTGNMPSTGIKAVLLVTDGVSDAIQTNSKDFTLAKSFMQKTDSNSAYQAVCESVLSQKCFQSMDDDATFLLYHMPENPSTPADPITIIHGNRSSSLPYGSSAHYVSNTKKQRIRHRNNTSHPDKQMPWNSSSDTSVDTIKPDLHNAITSFMRILFKKSKM